LRPIRIAVLGHGTLELFAEVIRLWLGLEGFRADLYVSAYGSFQQELLNPQSGLYAFEPDVVWMFTMNRDLHFPQVGPGATSTACDAAVLSDEMRTGWRKILDRRPLAIVQNTVEASALRTFGHYEAAVPWSRSNLVHQLNRTLGDYALAEHVTVFDLNYVAQSYGFVRWSDARQWHQSKQPFAPDAFGLVAFHFAKLLGATRGTAKKCLVLDLDNTLWGGVVGDDGVAGISLGEGAEGESFSAFQLYLKALHSRGVLLAVCSKNEESIAQEPFRTHPGMHLRLEDIACFRANWENKADNLRYIARALNLGLDSLVFVDDNPSERAIVRAELPQVSVLELPSDPSNYAAALAAACFFETNSFSSEDLARGRFYQENAARETALSSSTDLESFLRGLDMEATGGVADPFHLPRMEQLLAKTNQFHLTTTRPSAAELSRLAEQPRVWMRWFSLKDKFGDHGLISVVILVPEGDAMAVDSWAMSCRVFSRGMEEFVFLEMCRAARDLGAARLIGRYKPTAKNQPVADLYQKLGFAFDVMEGDTSRWVYDLHAPDAPFQPFIRWSRADSLLGQDHNSL
jgi:FkbH-like protein